MSSLAEAPCPPAEIDVVEIHETILVEAPSSALDQRSRLGDPIVPHTTTHGSLAAWFLIFGHGYFL